MKKQKIVIDGKEVVIKAVPLGTILDALDIVEKLPDTIERLDLGNETNNTRVIIKLIKESKDDMFQLIAMLSGLDKEVVSQLGIRDSMNLIKVLLEINEVAELKKDWGEIAKLFKKEKK